MWPTLFVRRVVFVYCFLFLSVSACVPEKETVVPLTGRPAEATTIPATPTMPMAEPSATAATATIAATASTATAVPTFTPGPSVETAAAPATAPIEVPLVVAFVKDGDVQLWDEVTQQNETIFSAGDAIAVWMSDDGQVIAFLRRWIEQIDDQECWRSALWTVEWNGRKCA